jgi:hypothetical protein
VQVIRYVGEAAAPALAWRMQEGMSVANSLRR